MQFIFQLKYDSKIHFKKSILKIENNQNDVIIQWKNNYIFNNQVHNILVKCVQAKFYLVF